MSNHPLDPLTPEELQAVIDIVKNAGVAHANIRFIYITLEEPAKNKLIEGKSDNIFARQARAILLDNNNGETQEILVSLDDAKILQQEAIPGVQPPIVLDEFLECETAAKSHPDFQAAMRRRGITDFDLLMVDPWSAGNYGDEREAKQRLARTLTWVRPEPGANGFARPVEGVMAWIDLNKMELVHLEDTGVVPIPEAGEYAGRYFKDNYRKAPQSLEISQPDGPSFKVNGNHVEWMNWSFHVGFTAREGLVLHQIAYHDQDRLRSIIHRASLSEMVVPYGDPHINYARRNAFDVGEYGIGHLANSLKLGCDCLGLIHYFDAHAITSRGEILEIENAICMHEEDYGILWKHTDWRTEEVDVRRSRRLVVSSVSTVGNYEYGFFWYLYLDGTIQFEIKMTGIINTGALPPGETRKYGTVVAPGLYGPIHQHIFNVRLDMAVDGPNNSVYEVNTKAEPMGPDNPLGNAFYAEATQLKSEAEAARTMDLQTARYWKITNPNVANSLGEAVAYKLMPGENAFPFVNPESSVRRRAGFMNAHFWATAHHPRELYAAGDYPNQSDPDAAPGLPTYAKQNRSLDNTSLTVWYTINSHHVVRPEDWPVMPVCYIGFNLKPMGFFERNPAINLPPRHGA